MTSKALHIEKTIMTDEGDFKSNIPYNDETSTALREDSAISNKPSTSYNNDDLDDDDDDDLIDEGPNNFNCPSNWEQDDGCTDDNISRVGSEYSTYSASDSIKNFYASTTSKGAPGSRSAAPEMSAYQQECEFKYSPPEMHVEPPSSSRFNYPAAQLPQIHTRQMQPPHPYATQQQHNPHPTMTHGGHQQHPHHHGAPPAPQHFTGTYMPGFHPNMWHPNAPYGTSGSGSGGGAAGYGGYGPYASHRYAHYGAGYPHDNIMEMMQMSNSGREARNRAEKNRRDKLNGSIQELSTMVPHVAESPRRVDKTAVLRFAAHGMRLKYVFGDQMEQPRQQITDSVMRLLDSFFLTVTCHGQIVLISSSIEQHLGHCQADLYGQNILHITHPDDHNMIKQRLIPTDLETLFQADDETGEPSPRTKAEEEYIDRKLREDKRSFTVRLARAGPRSEPTTYELVKIDGSFRRSDMAPRGVKTSTFPSSLQLIRRTRGRDDAIPLHTISGNDIVMIAIARIIHAPKIIDTNEFNAILEYKTRHTLDGRIVACEQRISLVAGYMTDEVIHLNPFTFMHQDDARWVILSLRKMYKYGRYGESTYRLLTRNGKFVYLVSKGYLEINKETNGVTSFVCMNTLLEETVGKNNLFEMKKQFSLSIKHCTSSQSAIDMPASENPLQLEKAVMCLIQNLQRPTSDDDEPLDEIDYICGVSDSQLMSDTMLRSYMLSHHRPSSACSSSSLRSTTKTPPLTLIPPEVSTIRTSISKSVKLVNFTAARNLRNHQQRIKEAEIAATAAAATAASSAAEVGCDLGLSDRVQSSCSCRLRNDDCKYCQGAQAEAAIKRISSASVAGIELTHSSGSEDEEDIKMPKLPFKTTEIKEVITSTLDQLGRTLDQQLNTVNELRDQGNIYDVPIAGQCIEEIMEEHQKQNEIYVNIRSEIESQLQNNNNKRNIDEEGNNAAANTTKKIKNDSTVQHQHQQNPTSNLELQPR